MKPPSDKDFEACLSVSRQNQRTSLSFLCEMSSERLEFLQDPLLCCDMFTRVLFFLLCRLTSVQDTAEHRSTPIKHEALCENWPLASQDLSPLAQWRMFLSSIGIKNKLLWKTNEEHHVEILICAQISVFRVNILISLVIWRSVSSFISTATIL